MNLKIYNRCVEIARALKTHKTSGKSFHSTFIIRKSKIVCIGFNDYNKLHNANKFGEYKNYRNLPGEYKPSLHSEISALIKWGEEDLSDCEILNIRIDNNFCANYSAACPNCQRVIRGVRPKRVYHSNKMGQLEELILD